MRCGLLCKTNPIKPNLSNGMAGSCYIFGAFWRTLECVWMTLEFHLRTAGAPPCPFLLLPAQNIITILAMEKDMDITKVVRQHLQMENFFTGGFMVRSSKASSESHSNEDKQVEAELEKIAEEVSKCRKCGLGSSRTNSVPGEGNTNARIVFVGEGPGADEDAQGRPFVGRAGQLLDKIIAGMGLKRSDVFICNVLKCRPPDNRDPRPEEIISCMPYLQTQIELINPEIIVALGAHAARSLLNNNLPIGQLRGQFHEYYTGIGHPSIKLMATYHPAYLLRNYSDDNRKRVWEDMKKVLAELGLAVPKNQKHQNNLS